MPSDPNLQAIVDEIHAALAPRFGEGEVADYIPQLARVDPRHFGLAVVTLDDANAIWRPDGDHTGFASCVGSNVSFVGTLRAQSYDKRSY